MAASRSDVAATIGTDLDVDTVNFGSASQGSAEIAVRQGGLKPLLTLVGNQIPSGSTAAITVTAIEPTDGWTQYSKAGTVTMHGVLAGVSGTLQHTVTSGGHSYSFVPDAAPNFSCAGSRGLRVQRRSGGRLPGLYSNHLGGREQFGADRSNQAGHRLDGQRDSRLESVLDRRHDPGDQGRLGGDLRIAVRGSAELAHVRDSSITNGLAASGVTPTPDDTAAVAAGNIPRSLTVDGTHFTQAAYTAIGHHLASLVDEKTSLVEEKNWI